MAHERHKHVRERLSSAEQERDERLTHTMKSVWTIIGICIIVVVVGFVIGSIALAIWTLVVAGLIVFVLRRPVKWLQGKGMPRAASSAILLVALVAAIVAVFVSFVPLIIDQLAALANALPGYIAQIQEWWSEFVADHPDLMTNTYVQEWVSSLLGNILNATSSLQTAVVAGVYQAGVSLANFVMYGLMAFLVAFWILIDYDKMAHEVHILAGRTAEWYLMLISTIFSRVLGGYLRGTIITAILIAIVSGIGYAIAGLPFAVVLGIFMGLFSIIPYLGPIVATIVVALLALFSGPFAFVVSLIVSIAVPWAMSSFVSPKIMSSTVNLHPGIIMVAIIAGGALGGIAGMIFAIPVTAAAKCLLVYFFEAITGRQLVGKKGAVFAGSPTDVIDPVADATDNYLTSEKLRAMVEGVESNVRKVEHVPSHKSVSLFQELAQPMEHITARKLENVDDGEEPADTAAESAAAGADTEPAEPAASEPSASSSSETDVTGRNAPASDASPDPNATVDLSAGKDGLK